MPDLRHIDNTGTARFVTFTCFHKYPYLLNAEICNAVLEALTWLRREHSVKVLGYVVMPEHVHLILHPPEGAALGRLIGRMKARSARAILALLRDPSGGGEIIRRANGDAAVWQRRCFDHNCRGMDIVVNKIRYCHNNPVRRGLVSEPGEWPWSSYNWYVGQREGALEIDGMEI